MTTYGTDYQYLNIRIFNDSVANNNKSIPARYEETRVQPILDFPNEYELSIVRFSIPTNTIPILIWPGDDVYKITLEWRGVQTTAYLTFAGQGLDLYGKAIYHYQEICDSFNIAMKSTWDDMAAAFPGALPAPDFALYSLQSPRLIFNFILKKFQFVVPYETSDYSNPSVGADEIGHWATNNPDVPNRITIYFNREMEKFMSGFQYIVDDITNGDSDTFYQMIVSDGTNNIVETPSYNENRFVYVMKQTYSDITNVNDFANIVFRTSRIPIVSEFKATQVNEFQQILTDFIPEIQEFNASDLLFNPTGPLRYYPIITNTDFRSVDVDIYWENTEGKQFPVYLLPNKTITVKIQFRKRTSIVLDETLRAGDEA